MEQRKYVEDQVNIRYVLSRLGLKVNLLVDDLLMLLTVNLKGTHKDSSAVLHFLFVNCFII